MMNRTVSQHLRWPWGDHEVTMIHLIANSLMGISICAEIPVTSITYTLLPIKFTNFIIWRVHLCHHEDLEEKSKEEQSKKPLHVVQYTIHKKLMSKVYEGQGMPCKFSCCFSSITVIGLFTAMLNSFLWLPSLWLSWWKSSWNFTSNTNHFSSL